MNDVRAPSEPADELLITRAQQGDRAALEALLARHQDRIYAFGVRMCKNREDAKDIVQETLLAASRALGDFKGNARLSTWLFTIARRFCLKKHGRDTTFGDTTPLDELSATLVDPQPAPDQAAANRELEAAFEVALGELDPKYREVLLLRDVEGLTAPEVGEILGLTVEAVKSRLHRARVTVRDRLTPMLGLDLDLPSAGACPDIITTFSRYLEGDIGPDVCADMERHLAACPRCTVACDSLKRTLALCKVAPTPSVPADIKRQLVRDLHALANPPRG
ncbi:sigma-70 family RNA polymerase sigma factor [Myxococcota bacterium]|nr:sigma-70 family RNA polymerase sigma factor [Myxococcota bacterium]